jgi:hypothetical protein
VLERWERIFGHFSLRPAREDEIHSVGGENESLSPAENNPLK